MSQSKSFLQDLDEAISRGTPESRSRALWHATDLLIAGRYSDDEIWTFGEVIGRLADEIEVAARAQLARRLARADNAPINIINKLAFDDSIDVAGPILVAQRKPQNKRRRASVLIQSEPIRLYASAVLEASSAPLPLMVSSWPLLSCGVAASRVSGTDSRQIRPSERQSNSACPPSCD